MGGVKEKLTTELFIANLDENGVPNMMRCKHCGLEGNNGYNMRQHITHCQNGRQSKKKLKAQLESEIQKKRTDSIISHIKKLSIKKESNTKDSPGANVQITQLNGS